jgi:hypothetical protein
MRSTDKRCGSLACAPFVVMLPSQGELAASPQSAASRCCARNTWALTTVYVPDYI